MSDTDRKWHPEFQKYTEFIVNHPNYKGLFYERGRDGTVNWVVAGKSAEGKERRAWWDEKCRELGIPIEAGCYAKAALYNHPTKFHVCQICGTSLSVEYVYPNKRLTKKLKSEFRIDYAPYSKTIFELVDEIVKEQSDILRFLRILGIKISGITTAEGLKELIFKNFVLPGKKGFLSPGAMSNSPDRFDGYHSDGACCRHKSDKGRHQDNLSRYGQDRRVYENWADGDWKKADRLMSMFRKHGVSADHIGPISLGFCHRPKFHPLSKEENSSKNNRMSLSDVQILIDDEKSTQVVSWHSKFIWDRLKHLVKNDKDAVKLSDFMRKNLHHVLIIFSMISEHGFDDFLEQFLNPQYSYFDYKFIGFDPETGTYERVLPKKLTGQNQKNNIERYKRIAFEKLQEYKEVDNRKINSWDNPSVDAEVNKIILSLNSGDYKRAKIELDSALSLLAEIAYKSWLSF